MCLGVPGRVTMVEDDPHGLSMGRVEFGGITKNVCLAYVPGVKVGDYVIVHVGFALSIVDEDEARAVFEYMRQAEEYGEADKSSGQ